MGELQVVEDGGAKKLIALLKAGPNHPVTPHAARALQALACRHPSAQVSDKQPFFQASFWVVCLRHRGGRYCRPSVL